MPLTKEDIKIRLPLLQYVSRTVEMRKAGKAFMGLCPFHPDSETKSLAIYDEENRWHCFGCGKDGDIFTWIMERDRCDFKEAQVILRRELGDVPQAKQKILDIELARRFHDTMPTEKRDYYHKRGLTDGTIDKFMLGYTGQAFSIPIFDAQGVLRDIKYRKDDSIEANKEKPKFWHIEGAETLLFNSQATEKDEVIYCEGELDCILLLQMGHTACTGTSGVNTFDRAWIPLFAKCKRVYVCLDNDAAGREWAPKIKHMIGSHAVIVTLPEGQGKDVTEFLLKTEFDGNFDKLLTEAAKAQERAERIEQTGLLGELDLKGFLRSYVEYASALTDAPREYHVAVGLAIVAATIGNNINMRLWGDEIYPHIWQVLISPSGFYRKTTSMKLGIAILAKGVPDAILMDDYTPETLKKNLAAKPAGLMKAWEFGDLLERMERDYMRGTKEFLTTIYDVGYSKANEKDGTINIQKPALTLLSGSTLDWLQSKVKVGDMRGGFLSRFLFLPAYHKTDWKGVEEHHDLIMQDELAKRLQEIRQVNGRADLSLVRDKLNSWLRQHENLVDAEKLPKELMGFYSRSATYVAKLSVLFQVAEDKGLVVTEGNLERAITYLEYLYEQLSFLVADGLGVNTRAASRMRTLKEILSRSGEDGLSRANLLHQSHMEKRDFDNTIGTLVETGEIKASTQRTGERGPKSVIYILASSDKTLHRGKR